MHHSRTPSALAVRRYARHRQHLPHHFDRRRGVLIRLGSIRIQHRNLIPSVPGANPRIVVVLDQNQIRGGAGVRRHQIRRDNRRRIVPTERPGRFFDGKSGIEMQHPAPIVVRRNSVFQNPVIDVAVRTDHGRSGTVGRHGGEAAAGVHQLYMRDRREGGAVQQTPDNRCRIPRRSKRRNKVYSRRRSTPARSSAPPGRSCCPRPPAPGR